MADAMCQIQHRYRFESNRLQSFWNWPCPWIKLRNLAAAGFYYNGEDDRVTCFACSVQLCRWEYDDDPMIEHRRWSAQCPFIRNVPCGNVSLDTEPRTISIYSSNVSGGGGGGSASGGIMYMPHSFPANEY